jgi:hypothetical protein
MYERLLRHGPRALCRETVRRRIVSPGPDDQGGATWTRAMSK